MDLKVYIDLYDFYLFPVYKNRGRWLRRSVYGGVLSLKGRLKKPRKSIFLGRQTISFSFYLLLRVTFYTLSYMFGYI